MDNIYMTGGDTLLRSITRSPVAYCNNYAKSLLLEIRNRVYNQSNLIVRTGGPDVSRLFCSDVLLELMAEGVAYVGVERAKLDPNRSLADPDVPPYHYIEYNVSFAAKKDGKIVHLRANNDEWYIDDEGTVMFNGYPTELAEIPITELSIGESLLTDIKGMQNALIRLDTADMEFLTTGAPLYTEQVDRLASRAVKGENEPVVTGHGAGRAYTQERPGFVVPPTDVIKASMLKQDQLKLDMRNILNLTLEGAGGIRYLSSLLEHAENECARFYNAYYNKPGWTVRYPTLVEPSADTLERATNLIDIRSRLPIQQLQHDLNAIVAGMLTGKYYDAAFIPDVDPEQIRADKEAGLVGANTASLARLYPPGEAAIANAEHLERLKAIAISQSLGARGIDIGDGGAAAKNEKTISQSADVHDDGKAVHA